MASIKKNEPQKIALSEINKALTLLKDLDDSRKCVKQGGACVLNVQGSLDGKEEVTFNKRITFSEGFTAAYMDEVLKRYGTIVAEEAKSKADKFEIEFNEKEKSLMDSFNKKK